jgi:hypothetical protein
MVVLAPLVLPAEFESLAVRVATALQSEAERFTEIGAAPKIEMTEVQFKKVTDPVNQQAAYEGVWRNARNTRCGTFSINSDTSFYAEYDLFCPHPRDSRWFVEMVTAWGNLNSFRCEAKLIPSI